MLKHEGSPLVVDIVHNRIEKTIRIKDNSIGMTRADLVEALRLAHPTADSKGRSQYGMGMKTAACWIARNWKVVTCEWASGEEWTANVDVRAIAHDGAKIPLSVREVGKDLHYTELVLSDLHRGIQRRSEETIRAFLGSMYRFDLMDGTLKINLNGEPIPGPDEYDFDTDASGKTMRRDLPAKEINGKKVRGWIGVLRKGGRKYGGFSLFQHRRQIQGFPHAWKPRSIFGGVEDEGANNLISQRLVGLLELEGFDVSHTKDAVLFQDDEEEQLEKFLKDETKDYRLYAQRRRAPHGNPWTDEKLRDLAASMKKEFTSNEMKDAVNTTILPPLDTIIANAKKQLASLNESEMLVTLDVLPDLKVVLSRQNKSEFEPHLTIGAGASKGMIHVVINGLHPYYCALEHVEAINECIRQYIYDAIAEYRVAGLQAKVVPESVRRFKSDLLRAQITYIETAASDDASEDEEAHDESGTQG